MAHFAELGLDNIVLRVVTVNNDVIMEDGNESEAKGQTFCRELFGGTWVQTSYNGNFRKNYAAIGYRYDSQRDAFIPPTPYNSWVLNESTCRWEAPLPVPDDAGTGTPPKNYIWDEPTISWKLVE